MILLSLLYRRPTARNCPSSVFATASDLTATTIQSEGMNTFEVSLYYSATAYTAVMQRVRTTPRRGHVNNDIYLEVGTQPWHSAIMQNIGADLINLFSYWSMIR